MSVFQFGGNKYFAEHNIPLSSDEIGKIVGFVSGALAKMDDGALVSAPRNSVLAKLSLPVRELFHVVGVYF